MTGILIERGAAPPRWALITLAAASILLSIKYIKGRRNAAATFALIISFAMIGALLSSSERNSVSQSRLKSLFDLHIITADDPVEMTAILQMPPEPAPGAYYLDVEAEAIRLRDEVIPATGRARLMIALAGGEATDEFNNLSLDYGSRIRVLVRLERARSYSNPGSSDFNDFLERQGYDLKGTIKSPLLIEALGRAPDSNLLGALYHARLALMSGIDARFTPRVAGTLKAMLVDNRYFLDQQAMERLREGSTFHVISISGMHVGIIAWALLGFGNALSFIARPSGLNKRRAFQVACALVALWCYAAMVGLVPPVTRAASMITVGLVGPLLFRRAASINTVALAAFVMLALKPALVADPGFQLSFVAVAGIVALALPLINKLRAIGDWHPAPHTPHPPSCPRAVRVFAESLFWDARRFDKEMRRSPVRYRLDKARAARVLGRFRAQPLIRGAVLLAITSMAIQLSTLPLMALYFNRLSPVGVLLNVAAGLLTALIMFCAIASIIFPHSLWVSAKLVWLTSGAHDLLINSIVPFTSIPGSTFRVPHYESPQSIIYALYFVPLMMLTVLIDKWVPVDRMFPADRDRATGEGESKIEDERLSARTAESLSGHTIQAYSLSISPALAVAVSLCLLSLFTFLIALAPPVVGLSSKKLVIHFLDVGQGDSALVVFPQGTTMLVDAGGNIRYDKSAGARDGGEEVEADFKDNAFSVGEAVVSRFLWSQRRTQLDYLLATHADADHIGGLSDVVKNFRVGEALVGHVSQSDPEFAHFTRAVASRDVTLSALSAGMRFIIEDVSVEVLWPPGALDYQATSRNNDSVVLRLVYGSVSILLAGDIEKQAETALVQSGIDLRADVLKVPHHGSKTSSTESLLDRVQPRCAVISVGERSRFGHPHEVVTARYGARGIHLYQTGRDGTVTVETDGNTLGVTSYRK